MVKRLPARMALDARLQFRNGFYYAAAFVVVIAVLLILWLPALDWGYLLPALVQNNLLISTFYFIAGLVLLEKSQGTLESQVVTPLRAREYLVSQVFTLTALAFVENLILVVAATGLNLNFAWWLVGFAAAGAFYTLCGFVVVARYDSINEYLFPSLLVATVLALPLLDYFGIISTPLMYLHPVQALLILMRAAFAPVEEWQLVYALLYSALWLGVLFWWSEQTFRRFVVRRAGG